MAINIFFAVITIIVAITLITFGCVLLHDGSEEGATPLVIGIIFILIPIALICVQPKSVETQYEEKQQAIITAQRELEKFLIDHPEMKESENE